MGPLLLHGFLLNTAAKKCGTLPPPPPALDLLRPCSSHLADSGIEGVAVHRIPKPINIVDGHGRCGTVKVQGGVRGSIGGGI